MPQLAIAMIVGAGFMAGYKWVSRELQRHADSAARAEVHEAQETTAAVSPRDLGALEWDERSQVYRPRRDS